MPPNLYGSCNDGKKNSLGFVPSRVFLFWKSNRRLLGTVIFTRDPYFRFPLGLYCQRRALLPPPNICAQCTRTGALGTVYVTQLKSRYLRIQRKEKAHTPFPISFVFFRLDIVVVWSLRCRRTRSAYDESQSPWSGSYSLSSLCASHICIVEWKKKKKKEKEDRKIKEKETLRFEREFCTLNAGYGDDKVKVGSREKIVVSGDNSFLYRRLENCSFLSRPTFL